MNWTHHFDYSVGFLWKHKVAAKTLLDLEALHVTCMLSKFEDELKDILCQFSSLNALLNCEIITRSVKFPMDSFAVEFQHLRQSINEHVFHQSYRIRSCLTLCFGNVHESRITTRCMESKFRTIFRNAISITLIVLWLFYRSKKCSYSPFY